MHQNAKAVCSLLFCCTFRAVGQIVSFETFDSYNTGVFNTGGNGGTGWTNTWTTSSANARIVDLSVALPGGGYDSGNRALALSGNTNNALSRSFPVQDEDIFISFDFTLSDGSIDNNDFASLWFGDRNGPSIGLKGNQATDNPANLDLFARTKLGAEAYGGPSNLNQAETYFIIGHLHKSSGSSTYDRYSVWVNPDEGDFASPDGTSTSNSGLSSTFTLGWRLVNMDADDEVLIDNLYLGNNWNDAFQPAGAIPELSHTTLILGLLFLSTTFIARRRKNGKGPMDKTNGTSHTN